MSGSVNRGTLPQNFLDSVRDQGLMLPTPQPQFFFAKMAMAGQLSLAALDAGAPTAQQFVSMSGGGAPVDPALDSLARAADAYPGFIQSVSHLYGEGAGDTVKFQRDILESSTADTGRELATDSSISTSGSQIKAEEIPVVLKEYHGPVASGASAVAPYAIWDFDAKYRANKTKLADRVSKHLQYDAMAWLDRKVRDQFLASDNITYAGGVSNVLSMTAGAGLNFNLEDILKARKALSDREWMPFSNGRYMCMVPTTFNTQMVNDVTYRELSKAHSADKNQLFGYIGSVQDVDFFECTTLATYAAGSSVGGQTVPAGAEVKEAILVGPGAVGLGNANGFECRWADDTNYGTVAKCIWYARLAFATLDTRGIQRILAQSV